MSSAEESREDRSGGEGSFPTKSGVGPLEEIGTEIGPYKLLSVLGEGGFGIVYLAEQKHPIRRQVALKLIKPGMDSKQVIARFEAERQALALLDHPNIAHVVDAGTTDKGLPYFVMEYVKGLSLTEHCDRNKLDTEQRLQLFVDVCDAIQYAHQKGIIHRDIKPSNVLVTLQGEKAVPKVIDFGVAKAISQPLTEKTLFTGQGQVLGTPAYMSPEQAELTNRDIDTRTDIYSLGVLLYELLTGALPFDDTTLCSVAFDEVLRIIRDQDPPRPSARLLSLGEEATRVAASRRTDIRTLSRRLHRELEWIPLKAMRKERDRRYKTAAELGEDVRNYLSGNPLMAGPEAWTYRVEKFAVRHAGAIVIAAAILSVVILSIAVIRTETEKWEIKRISAAENSLSEAESLFNKGQYEQALLKLDDLLKGKLFLPQVILLRARLLIEYRSLTLGHPNENAKLERLLNDAVPRLEELLNAPPDTAGAAHYLLAQVYLKTDLVKSEKHRQEGETLLSESAECYFLRGFTAATPREKIEWLNKALDCDARHYPSRRTRALAYYALKDYEKMAQDTEVMIATRPDDWLGYACRAMARREKGQYEDAIHDHNRAIQRRSEPDPELYNQRSQTYVRMKDYERALLDAEKCVELQPKEKDSQFQVFCILVALGRYDEAKAKYAEVFQPDARAASNFRDLSERYVFDALSSNQEVNLPDDSSGEPAFRPLWVAANYYRYLNQKGKRLVANGFKATWSPDGAKLAYTRIFPLTIDGALIHPQPNGLEILDLKSGRVDLLAYPGKDPTWSPDGRHIAFVRERYQKQQNQTVHQIPAEDDRPWGPETGLMPDNRGQTESQHIIEEEIWVFNTGDHRLRFVTQGGYPSWSRDSRRVYYRSALDSYLYSISIEDGDGKAQPQRHVHCDSYYPVVSPDERHVAYGSASGIHIVELTSGSPIDSWATPAARGILVQWAPNGRELSVGSYGDSDFGLWIYDLDKRTCSKVVNGSATMGVWSPDGHRVVFDVRHWPSEIWIADLQSNVSTTDALGPGQTIDDHYAYLTEDYTRAIEAGVLDARERNRTGVLATELAYRGVDHYRKGSHDRAVQDFGTADAFWRALGIECPPWATAYLTMSHHRLGHADQAESALERLRERYEHGRNRDQINYLIAAETLLAERAGGIRSVWECIQRKELDKAAELLAESKSEPPANDPYFARRIQSARGQLVQEYVQYSLSSERRGEYAQALAYLETAVEVDPNHVAARNEYASLLATCPEAEFRDGAKAVESATTVCQLANWKDPGYLDTLAAAYAETGNFESAIEWQTRAIDQLTDDERSRYESEFRARLKLYQEGQAYHRQIWIHMVGWWKLDESGGRIAPDCSGHNNHGKLVGDPRWRPAGGKFGGALEFDGTGDYVVFKRMVQDDFTLMAWIKSDNEGSQAGQGRHAYEGSGLIGWDVWGVTDDFVSAVLGKKFSFLVGRPDISVTSDRDVVTGDWVHVAAVRDTEEGKIGIYINGAHEKTVAHPNTRPLTAADSIAVGGTIVGDRCYSGLIDDVRIYSCALSETEIKAIYDGTEEHRATAEPLHEPSR
jgi:serine/threonine protein kinase/predicted Zn-dependent protease